VESGYQVSVAGLSACSALGERAAQFLDRHALESLASGAGRAHDMNFGIGFRVDGTDLYVGADAVKLEKNFLESGHEAIFPAEGKQILKARTVRPTPPEGGFFALRYDRCDQYPLVD
jgi:hypothetical protein